MLLLAVMFIVLMNSCCGVISDVDGHDNINFTSMPPLFGLDDYDSCLSKPIGLYCLVRMDLYGDKYNKLLEFIQEYSKDINKHYNYTYIDRGICASKSCRRFINDKHMNATSDLKSILEGCLNESIYEEHKLQVKLSNIYYCHTHTQNNQKEFSKTDDDDKMLAIVICCIVFINAIGSLYHIQLRSNQNSIVGNEYLLSFSLLHNWNALIRVHKNGSRFERLKGIDGLRSITTFFMVIAHVMWLIGNGFTDNPSEFEKASGTFYYQLIFNGMMIVQLFFVLSGFLLVYNLEIVAEHLPISWSILPKAIIARWLRLSPGNALMLAFTATWLRRAGSGPLWDLYVSSVATDCRRYWWLHLLYVNNYYPEDKFCAVQSWHVSADFQLFILGVIAYIATRSRGRTLVLSLLLLTGMIAPALHVWLQDLDALVILRPEFYRTFSNDTYRYLHVFGHNNLSCYAIGMMIGYLCYSLQKNNVEIPKYNVLRYITWCLLPAIIVLLLSGNVYVRGTYAATHRVLFGLITAFLILNLIFRFEDNIRGLLEWDGWVVSSRLCYGVYLLHVNFIHILLGARTQLAHVSFYYVVIHHLGIVTLSFIAAVPLYLLIEAPVAKLTKLLLDGRHQGPELLQKNFANDSKSK